MKRGIAVLREWIARLRGTVASGRTDQDLEAELRAHLEMADEDARARRGELSNHQRRARLKAGGLPQAVEALRDQRGLPWLDDFLRDLVHAWHLLRRSPAFTTAAVLSLALGVGANSAVFSFADTLLLRPLPVPHPGGLLTVGSPEPAGGGLISSYREYVDIRDRSTTFSGLAAFTSVGAAFGVGDDASPRLRLGMLVSGNLFGVIGISPLLGRDFRPEEDRVPGRDPVVILGHEFWQALGGDAGILGHAVRLNGVSFTVIGVAPPEFTGLDQYTRFEFFAPLAMWPSLADHAAVAPLEDRSLRSVVIKGRLNDGATIATARAELSQLGRDLEQAYPDSNRRRALTARTEVENRIAQAPPIPVLLWMMAALALAVLLVACGNVAGLLASRAPVRGREIALRMAIGAGRFRIVRQLITESLLIAGIGGVLGVAIGYGAVAFFRHQRLFATDLPIAPVFALDERALLVSLAAAAASAVIFGLSPALRASRLDLTSMIKAAEGTLGRRRAWGRSGLVVAQVATSVVLLVVATFMHRGFQQRLSNGPSFRIDEVMLLSVNPGLLGYDEAQTHQFLGQLVQSAREAPRVRSATLTSYVPLDGRPPRVSVVPEGFTFPPGTEEAQISSAAVGELYFETLDIPILNGRGFVATDDAQAPRVAIVNQRAAERYWPAQNPVGKRFRMSEGGGAWVEVVGVARNSKYSFMTEPTIEFIYFPYRQRPPRPMILVAHTVGDPAPLAAPLRDIVRRLDPNLPIYNVRSMREFYEIRTVAVLTLINRLIAAMGIMGLCLAIVGLYGLVAFAASRRTREIGIRMAVGAGRVEVLRMVLRQGMTLALAGLGLGLMASAGADRALGAMFVGGPGGDHRSDPVAFVLVSGAVVLVTVVAAYIPARRASRINPTEALRCE